MNDKQFSALMTVIRELKAATLAQGAITTALTAVLIRLAEDGGESFASEMGKSLEAVEAQLKDPIASLYLDNLRLMIKRTTSGQPDAPLNPNAH